MRKIVKSNPIILAAHSAGLSKNKAPREEKFSAVIAEKLVGLVRSGVDERHLALYFDITVEDLKRLYGQIMVRYHIEANVNVANALYKNATEHGTKQSVDAQKFWMKARGGWREKDEDVHRSDGIEIHIHV